MKTIKMTSVLIGMMLIALTVKSQNVIVDHSFEDKDFLKFKMKLTNAILDKDTAQLFALVDEKVVLSNTSLEGKAQFKNVFTNELYNYSSDYNPWDELLEVMAFGFRKNVVGREGNSWRAKEGEIIFQAPSYQKFIEKDHDIYLMVLADHVNVREKPTIYSKKLRSVSKMKLKYEFPDQGVSPIFNDGYNWVKVEFNKGEVGYIVDEFTSLKLTKEISVKKINGEFRIVSYYSLPGC